MKKIAVVGVGNLIMKDDGVGIHVVEELKKHNLPEGVHVIDAGTTVLDVIINIRDSDKAIVIDAVTGGGKPGDVYRFTPEDVSDGAGPPLSMHEVSFLGSLKLAELSGGRPRNVVIIGVEPAEITLSLELSDPVRAKIPFVIDRILKEINEI
jgi:hydrogenase maturation protease